MTFSGALTLTDLNDFITPSQACIKPVTQLNAKSPEKDSAAAATEIQIDGSGAYYEVIQNGNTPAQDTSASPKKLEQAQINLNDCLACSGCITSAESVLITLQSHTEVLNFLESNQKALNPLSSASEPYKIPVISISPQTLASLAAATAASNEPSTSTLPSPPTPRQILQRLRAFCTQSLGFSFVFDTTFARHLALQEHVAEFGERWRAAGQSSGTEATDGSGGNNTAKGLPMLASACPGWICYAEKAHSEMLPFISRTKSPQQVMGTLVKNWMGARWGKGPNEIYHVTVMPCYDKKLEASRTDFYNDLYSTRDVDCVITTGELEVLMKEKAWDITQPVPGELDDYDLPTNSHGAYDPFNNAQRHPVATVPSIQFPELLTPSGSSSGSYLSAIVSHLQSTSDVPLTLNVQTVRGADYEEYVLTKRAEKPGEDDVVVFKGAKCYGFRNLQNVVRRVGRERGLRSGSGAAGKLAGRAGAGLARRIAGRRVADGKEEKKERSYDYVEVMACPGGCVNGGGQLKPVTAAPEVAAPSSSSATDSEGYKRDWEASGVSIAPPIKSSSVDVSQNARWGTKEWTKKVEDEYWREPYTDIVSRLADGLVRRIYDDMCGYGEDITREASGRRFFRTEYRAVESEVVGLAVVW
ncbi:hypothetical protein H0H93_003532 [Arthromyces matolae]|nr:hypothetical protein H0H93_003532 [Arthromyces matolae]